MKKITIFDTTLRDGEQAPGNSITIEEKSLIAKKLELLGVDTIEAGFPETSQEDYEAVCRIAKEIKGCKICAFARLNEESVKLAGKSLEKALCGQIELQGGGSDINLMIKRGITRKEGIKEAERIIAYAKKRFPKIEISFGVEDASRADPIYLIDLCKAAIKAGAKVIVLADTVGCAVPENFGKLFSLVKEGIPEDVVLGVHCHNDLGLSIANSLIAIQNGATEVQVTLNGIGERCGNASLEAFVMLLKTHPEFGKTNIKTNLLYETSQILSKILGREPAYEAPVIGKNAFLTQAGIHQKGILKNPIVYQAYPPEIVGRKQDFALGRHSGKAGFAYKLKEMGFNVSEEELIKIIKIAKESGLKIIDENTLNKICREILERD